MLASAAFSFASAQIVHCHDVLTPTVALATPVAMPIVSVRDLHRDQTSKSLPGYVVRLCHAQYYQRYRQKGRQMGLSNPTAFFDAMREGLLGPTLSTDEVNGCNAILKAMDGAPLSWAAYAMATAYHETASTMQPIREYGGPTYFTRMYDVQGARPKMAVANGNTCAGDGPKYCGRGYVQLTWKNNYARAGKECGVDLVSNPDIAMRPDIAAKIMRQGMERGWFTGKGFADYLPRSGHADRPAFTNARRIINGTDKAAQIAEHAMKFQSALAAGGWF